MARWETSNESMHPEDKRSLENFCESLYRKRKENEEIDKQKANN